MDLPFRWYAALFVTAEGWLEQNLKDSEIETLLADESKWKALRRFGNGIFHFQADYYDKRIVDFVALGADSAGWVGAIPALSARSGPSDAHERASAGELTW